MSSDDDLRAKIVDFHEWLTKLVPGAASWPWFLENEARIEEFAAEALRQGKSATEVKALIGMSIAGAAGRNPRAIPIPGTTPPY